MSKLKDQEQLKKYIEKDLLGEIPIFFNQCTVKDKKEERNRLVNVSAFQTTQYQVNAYHKVISKII